MDCGKHKYKQPIILVDPTASRAARFNKLSSTLENRKNLNRLKTPDRSKPDSGELSWTTSGRAKNHDRCKSPSVSYWSFYRTLPADVCGVNCFLDSPVIRERRGEETKKRHEVTSHIAVVACGPRLEETLIMLKSALLFSKKPLHFHIFAENELHDSFRYALPSWPAGVRTKFNFTIYPITFPTENEKEWKKLFKPCASQRLFLPLILKELDSLLYVDTDILFLQPVENIWALLSEFNGSQVAGMAPEHEEPRIGWYNRFGRHPYYGKTGINSGVMLMNMTRLRERLFKNDMTSVTLRWKEILVPLLQKYKLNITWGDQDLLNIIFHHNPESLYVFPCQWNYRPDHCIYGSNCQEADKDGVFILHGNRAAYHDDKQPAFRAIYEAFKEYSFGDNMTTSLLQPLEESLQKTTHTYCGRVSHLLIKRLKHSIMSVEQIR
ncbi:glucoside xylosyltransferase 1-like [Neosynchiropus ocellatus]